MTEVWKLIDGLKYHEVSNTGKVRSVGNIVTTKNGVVKKLPDRELTGSDNGLGYRKVHITENGIKCHEYIHRIVAKAFVPNPQNKPCVNHIDNDPANNNADNLEWVTKWENTNWMIVQGRFRRTEQWLSRLHESQKEMYVPVIGTNCETGEEMYFERVNAVRESGFRPGEVSRCINGKRKSHKGHTWRRA